MTIGQDADVYEHVLSDLRKRREELDVAIRAILAVRTPVSTPPISTDNAAPLSVTPVDGIYTGVSIADASKQVLEANYGPMNTADIANAVQAGGIKMTSVDPSNTVNSILSRRAQSVGDIVRVGRGRWDLKARVSRAQSIIGRLSPDEAE